MDTPIEPSTTEVSDVPDAIAKNLLWKVDAGAALLYSIYHHPRARELIKEFGTSRGFFDALASAQQAYRVGGR